MIFFIILLVLVFVVGGPAIYHQAVYKHRTSHWEEGRLPAGFGYSKENHEGIMIVFGCLVSFREEERSVIQKLSRIQDYLKSKFPAADFNVVSRLSVLTGS